MSSFSLHIATDNAAFFGRREPDEIGRILRLAADRIETEGVEGTVRDVNGNTVGRYFTTDRNQALDDAAALDMIEGAATVDRVVEAVDLTGRTAVGFTE